MFIRVQDKIINTNMISCVEINYFNHKTLCITLTHDKSLSFEYKSAAEAKKALEWLTEVLIHEE